MDEIPLTVAPDEERWPTHELEVDPQRLPEAFDERQGGVRSTALDDGDIPATHADGIGQLLLRDVERDARIPAEPGERSPKGR